MKIRISLNTKRKKKSEYNEIFPYVASLTLSLFCFVFLFVFVFVFVFCLFLFLFFFVFGFGLLISLFVFNIFDKGNSYLVPDYKSPC